MNLDDIKKLLIKIEDKLKVELLVKFAEFEREGRTLRVFISRQLYKNLS